jgi:predicted amidophosphoribosyltransferase
VLCGIEAAGARLCADCTGQLERNDSACARCAEPLPLAAPLCGKCLQRLPAFDAAWAGYLYRAPFDHLVQRLQFDNALAVGRALLDWAQRCATFHARRHPQALIRSAAPLAAASARLQPGAGTARDLGRELALPVCPPRCRVRATAMPGLDLNRGACARNIRGQQHGTAGRVARSTT